MVNCDILIRENRRTLCITIGKNGEVIVKAPIRLTEKQINDFILKKHSWIDKQVTKIQNANNQYNDVIKTNKVILFNELYSVIEISNIKQSTFQNNALYIKQCKTLKERETQIKKWYIKSANNILLTRLNYFSNLMNLNYDTFKLTNAKTKWGSCSSKRKIDLNWRLIMLKSELQDYVIVHELCHLLEMNHSQKFYKCIETVLKDYKKRRTEIKNSSFVLQLFR